MYKLLAPSNWVDKAQNQLNLVVHGGLKFYFLISCPVLIHNTSHVTTGEDVTIYRYLFGVCFHISGPETRHIPLRQLQPWHARFPCKNSNYCRVGISLFGSSLFRSKSLTFKSNREQFAFKKERCDWFAHDRFSRKIRNFCMFWQFYLFLCP